MAHPEDRDWEQIVEGVELQTSDADLAAAQAALRDVEPEELRPEFVDAVMARAHAESAALASPAFDRPPMRLLPRLRKVAAAAAILVGLMGLGALTYVVASHVWPTQQNSRDNLSYADAIVALLDPGETDTSKSGALFQINQRLAFGIDVLIELQRNPPGQRMASEVETLLATLMDHVSARVAELPPAPVDENLDVIAARLHDDGLDVDARVQLLRKLTSSMLSGVSAMRMMVGGTPQLRIIRDRFLSNRADQLEHR